MKMLNLSSTIGISIFEDQIFEASISQMAVDIPLNGLINQYVITTFVTTIKFPMGKLGSFY